MPDIKTLAAARNVDLVDTFTKSITKLSMMLSACEPIKAAAGETLHHKKITGKLATEEYTEGQAIPVSTYTWADVTTYEVDLKRLAVAVRVCHGCSHVCSFFTPSRRWCPSR